MEKTKLPSREETFTDGKTANEDRVAMLSDGVFAIAITLLVFDIRLPDALNSQTFLPAFIHLFLHQVVFYVLTFIIIARYWLSHRHLLALVKSIDYTFLVVNLILLAAVAFFPAATSVIESYSEFAVAEILYTVVLAGCGYAGLYLWFYALNHKMLIPSKFDTRSIRFRLYKVATTPTLLLLSLLLLFIPSIPPPTIFYSWLLIPVIISISQIIYRRKETLQERSYNAVLTDN